MKFICWLFSFFVVFSSCEKTLNIKPPDQNASLVVDGSIETNQPPIIFLTSSLNYFSSISPAILAGSQVRNARVTISDGAKTSQLREYEQALGNGYSIVFYSIDSANPAAGIVGQPGKTYQLTIQTNNNQYTASTTIPVLNKTLDSLWWKQTPGNSDSNKVVLMARLTDPQGFGNYIRYFTRLNKGNFLPGANSVFDDQIVDGTTYEVQVDQGINRNDPPKFENYGFFTRGDTITVKYCNIDRATFDFWRTLEFSYQSIGNPFSSPTSVLGNVEGALGAFCGYAADYRTLIVPK